MDTDKDPAWTGHYHATTPRADTVWPGWPPATALFGSRQTDPDSAEALPRAPHEATDQYPMPAHLSPLATSHERSMKLTATEPTHPVLSNS